MFAFRGVDYLEIDSLLNDDEKLVRQMVREFVEKEIIPHIEEWNREGKFPLHLVPIMAELGFYGDNLQGYGCEGMPLAVAAAWMALNYAAQNGRYRKHLLAGIIKPLIRQFGLMADLAQNRRTRGHEDHFPDKPQQVVPIRKREDFLQKRERLAAYEDKPVNKHHRSPQDTASLMGP